MKKKFDAVAESRKWRTTTGKKLSAMSEEDRLAYLNQSIAERLEAMRKKAAPTKARSVRTVARKSKAHA